MRRPERSPSSSAAAFFATVAAPARPVRAATLAVYTDGACSNNGKRSAQAGYGVWFGEQDPRNISEPLSGSIQTNQRAEMQAMLAAFCAIARERNVSTAALSRHDRPPRLAVAIYSDSMYVLNGLQKWIKNWRGKWTNAAGKPVANKDLWMQLDAEHGALKSMPGVAVQLLHVKGHSGSVGNDGADALAVAGAERLRRRRRSSEATRAAAEADDVAGAEPPSKRPRTSAAPSATKKKRGFYAVANGHGGFCGVVGTWTECARLVLGVGGGTKHKKFSSASDAVAFVAAHGARPTLQESAAAAAAATAALSAGVGGGSADDPIELID